jgi:hypothetical protein
VLDRFSATFVGLATQAGIPALGRHLKIFRRYARASEPAVLVCRAVRASAPSRGGYVLLLTRASLMVTRERWLRRPRLYLHEPVAGLRHVSWSSDPAAGLVDLAVGTERGRERFCLRALYASQMWRLDAGLSHIFRPVSERDQLAGVFTPA